MPFVRDRRSALVIVDMVVDSVTGFWPVFNPDELISNVSRVRDACYRAGIPVVQLQHTNRRDGVNMMLGEARDATGAPLACVEGTPGWQIVDELDPANTDIVVRKSRWHGFFGTELISVLHSLRAQQLVWVGGFTDCCLGLSVFEAYAHDYPCALVVDAASCTTEFAHKTAVLTMANWIYDLSIFTTARFDRWLAGEHVPVWYAGRHNTLPFAHERDVDRYYDAVLRGEMPSAVAVGAQHSTARDQAEC
jgi:biuret amidohydrolase